MLHGKTWAAAPFRVIADSGDDLFLACWPGVETRSPTTWIEWLLTGDDAVRKQAIPNLAAGRWELGAWTWRDTTLLSRYRTAEWFTVSRFFDADGHCGGWYVNFEVPHRRTATGIETFDLLLDLVVEPDLSGHRWKDEDEYAHGRRLGLITEEQHRHVDRAREEVLARIAERAEPFATDLAAWRRDPAWPLPGLPVLPG